MQMLLPKIGTIYYKKIEVIVRLSNSPNDSTPHANAIYTKLYLFCILVSRMGLSLILDAAHILTPMIEGMVLLFVSVRPVFILMK